MTRTSALPRRRGIAALVVAMIAGLAGIVTPGGAAEASIVDLTSTAVNASAAGDVVESYRYYSADSYQNLDAYYNTAWVGGSGRPAVVVIHGGSWANATKAASASVSTKFYSEGFAVFNINFRLTAPSGSHPGTPWPAQRIDTELAVRWVKANASKFGVNPNRIALYGFSSGGHVAVTAAGYYRSVRAAVSASGVLQPHRVMDIAVKGSSGTDVRTEAEVVLSQWESLAVQCPYYPTWVECGGRWSTFKPETYFAGAAPPFYAIMGDKDTVVPPGTLGAIRYWANRAGQSNVTVMVAGAGHSETILTGDAERWAAMIRWLRAKTA